VPDLYIIAGCNGAGKTTASYTVLPEILNCKEFVNADSIAAGLSPFNPEGVAFEAGRIMLNRVSELMKEQQNFAFETTLSAKSYVSLIQKAQASGYKVTLAYFWLSSPELALQRVADRVQNGGHNIPADVIRRRYFRGIINFFKLFMPVCDSWTLFNNSVDAMEIVARGEKEFVQDIKNTEIWGTIYKQGHGNETGEY